MVWDSSGNVMSIHSNLSKFEVQVNAGCTFHKHVSAFPYLMFLRPTLMCLVCHTSSNFSSLEITELVVFALNVRQVADHVVGVLSRTELRDLGTVVTKTVRSQHSGMCSMIRPDRLCLAEGAYIPCFAKALQRSCAAR
jgi:hypothetical protein